MSGSDVAKQLALGWAILLLAASGLLLIPQDARYIRAGYCALVSGVLIGLLVFGKPRSKWLRSTLVFLGGAFAVIGLAVAVGGAG